MNKTGIEWCDETWNPVTGCLHGCPYCYAKKRVHRFQGYELDGQTTTFNPYDEPAVLEQPLYIADKFGKRRRAAFPFGFAPTFHKYRLDEPIRKKTPKTIFVGSMCDLFGNWVPDDWIEQVFDTCRKAPQHRYLFLTKNPERYDKLLRSAKLLEGENIWYGSTATKATDVIYGNPTLNTFVSAEPLIEPIASEGVFKKAGTKLIILGAETGNRPDKSVPEKRWIKNLVDDLRYDGILIFMKDSIKPFWDGEIIREYPWEVET